jgi:hypothetical protein
MQLAASSVQDSLAIQPAAFRISDCIKVYNFLAKQQSFRLEMRDKIVHAVRMVACDAVFNSPEFFDDFVRHFLLPP